jgi:hypothetical protein
VRAEAQLTRQALCPLYAHDCQDLVVTRGTRSFARAIGLIELLPQKKDWVSEKRNSVARSSLGLGTLSCGFEKIFEATGNGECYKVVSEIFEEL